MLITFKNDTNEQIKNSYNYFKLMFHDALFLISMKKSCTKDCSGSAEESLFEAARSAAQHPSLCTAANTDSFGKASSSAVQNSLPLATRKISNTYGIATTYNTTTVPTMKRAEPDMSSCGISLNRELCYNNDYFKNRLIFVLSATSK